MPLGLGLYTNADAEQGTSGKFNPYSKVNWFRVLRRRRPKHKAATNVYSGVLC